MFALLFLLSFLLSFELTKQLLALFLSNGGLGLKFSALFLELLTNLQLVFLESLLHLGHLLFVNGHNDVGGHLALGIHAGGVTWLSALYVDFAA